MKTWGQFFLQGQVIQSHLILSYPQQGIFPKSFIYIKDVTVERKRYLPSFPRPDSLVACDACILSALET